MPREKHPTNPDEIRARIAKLEERQAANWKQGRVYTINFLKRRLAAAALASNTVVHLDTNNPNLCDFWVVN